MPKPNSTAERSVVAIFVQGFEDWPRPDLTLVAPDGVMDQRWTNQAFVDCPAKRLLEMARFNWINRGFAGHVFRIWVTCDPFPRVFWPIASGRAP
jgi:hypothetical protein